MPICTAGWRRELPSALAAPVHLATPSFQHLPVYHPHIPPARRCSSCPSRAASPAPPTSGQCCCAALRCAAPVCRVLPSAVPVGRWGERCRCCGPATLPAIFPASWLPRPSLDPPPPAAVWHPHPAPLSNLLALCSALPSACRSAIVAKLLEGTGHSANAVGRIRMMQAEEGADEGEWLTLSG